MTDSFNGTIMHNPLDKEREDIDKTESTTNDPEF